MLLLATSFVLLTTSCQTTTNKQETLKQDTLSSHDSTAFHDEHNSQNSVDWPGTYQDTIPCADCPGILTTVKLYSDGTYSYVAEYLERNTAVQDTGRFMWHNNGSVVHLKGSDLDTKYKVGENILFQADSAGNIIKSDMADKYTLRKVL